MRELFDVFFHQHPDVVRLKKHALPDWLESVDVMWADGGFTLYGFHAEDFYMLRTPDGMWKRAYLGQEDELFNREVLEQRYGLKHLCNAHTPSLGSGTIIPIYI